MKTEPRKEFNSKTRRNRSTTLHWRLDPLRSLQLSRFSNFQIVEVVDI